MDFVATGAAFSPFLNITARETANVGKTSYFSFRKNTRFGSYLYLTEMKDAPSPSANFNPNYEERRPQNPFVRSAVKNQADDDAENAALPQHGAPQPESPEFTRGTSETERNR